MDRFRLDLDGVELKDGRGRVVCLIRWRTREGLVVRLPESTDVTIPWSLVSDARLDLASGQVRLCFAGGAAAQLPWLQDAGELWGEWTDRHDLARAPSR